MKTIACSAPLGSGGLGQHVAQLVEDARARRELAAYHGPIGVRDRLTPLLAAYTPLRLSPGWRTYLGCASFDRAVARELVPHRVHVGFAGESLRTFRTARALGCERLELVSPTAHVNHVARQHRLAYDAYPLEESWLNDALRRRTLREYELADAIVVSSAYVRDSFLAEGVSADKLRLFPLTVSPRFATAARRPDGRFRLVATGSLSVFKGIPVLLEAFARLEDPDAVLTLVGGAGTRGMRRYVDDRLRREPRLRVVVGDPLPELARASAYVHASFQDGLGLAALEALAAGVPVVVSEDTGMKEHVEEGVNGHVVPTGDVDALAERLEALRLAWAREAAA